MANITNLGWNRLLLPFALLYQAITTLRNWAYDLGIFRTAQVPPFVISVGNLTVGGTGKTPHVEYLLSHLQDRYEVAMLSRGYGRKTKGLFLPDSAHATAETIGDEPMQIFHKFYPQVKMALAERRIIGARALVQHFPQTQMIVLDDAYQHRAMHRNLNLLLSDYYRPFFQDHLLPMGRLRESRSGAKRADLVIISKCPAEISESQREQLAQACRPYLRTGVPIFFTTIQYDAPKPLFGEGTIGKSIFLLTGIAHAQSLLDYLEKEKYTTMQHLRLPDHVEYAAAQVRQLLSQLPLDTALLTTEKDAVKLLKFKDLLKGIPIFYLPMRIAFVAEEEKFWEKVLADFC